MLQMWGGGTSCQGLWGTKRVGEGKGREESEEGEVQVSEGEEEDDEEGEGSESGSECDVESIIINSMCADSSLRPYHPDHLVAQTCMSSVEREQLFGEIFDKEVTDGLYLLKFLDNNVPQQHCCQGTFPDRV